MRVPSCGGFDQDPQGGEESRIVLFDEMATAARGANSFGRQVVLGALGAMLQLLAAGPDGGPGEAGGLSDEADTAASQRHGLTRGPLPAESLGHQRL